MLVCGSCCCLRFCWCVRSCRSVHGKGVSRRRRALREHIAVFIRAVSGGNTEKVNLEQTGSDGCPIAAFFFVFFLRYFFDIFRIFFQSLDSCFSVAWITSIKETKEERERERKKKYTTYITLCYEQNINL